MLNFSRILHPQFARHARHDEPDHMAIPLPLDLPLSACADHLAGGVLRREITFCSTFWI